MCQLAQSGGKILYYCSKQGTPTQCLISGARHLRRRTSSKPIVGHRAVFDEEAVDHRCANAGQQP